MADFVPDELRTIRDWVNHPSTLQSSVIKPKDYNGIYLKPEHSLSDFVDQILDTNTLSWDIEYFGSKQLVKVVKMYSPPLE